MIKVRNYCRVGKSHTGRARVAARPDLADEKLFKQLENTDAVPTFFPILSFISFFNCR